MRHNAAAFDDQAAYFFNLFLEELFLGWRFAPRRRFSLADALLRSVGGNI
jgi:hypothetical protein